jgi:hypothetical protein
MSTRVCTGFVAHILPDFAYKIRQLHQPGIVITATRPTVLDGVMSSTYKSCASMTTNFLGKII